MKVIIDADTVAFASAASAGDDSELWVATSRANQWIENIIRDTNADIYELWLSGPTNFRYGVYPEYKANRLTAHRPKWEKETKQFLVDNWQANWSVDCEADDMVGVRQCTQKDTIIAHIDKDINMIPGWHYNWELTRQGKVIREAKTYFITNDEANRFFWYQLLVGDPGTDNIKGVPGIGPKTADKILDSTPKADWYKAILDLYSCEEELDMNAQCLFIWRRLNDNWRNLLNDASRSQSERPVLSTICER